MQKHAVVFPEERSKYSEPFKKIFIVLIRIISQLPLLLVVLVFIINRLTHQRIFKHFPGTLLSCLSVLSLVIITSSPNSSHIGRLVISPPSTQRKTL